MTNTYLAEIAKKRKENVLRALSQCTGELTAQEICANTYLSKDSLGHVINELKREEQIDVRKDRFWGILYSLRP